MGKLARRFALDDIYAIGRNESWFSDMAQKGLHLKKFGPVFIYFEKGEPKNTKYRIDFIKEKPSEEQLDVYRHCGWNLVTSTGKFYVFSADERSCTTELHTDPIEQGFSLSELNKQLRIKFNIVSIAMMLFFGMVFSMYFLMDEPYLYMVEGQFVQQMIVVVVELYVFYSVIRNYLAIRNLKKSLLQGKAINHKENYQKARLTGGILASIFLPVALFTALIPIIEISKSEDYTLPDANTNLPIIRLSDIEQDPKLIREEGYRGDGVDWANRVSYDWSLLAPVQYEIDEHGIVEGEMWEDRSGEYSPSITTRFYKLTFGGLAENLTLDLINRYVYRDDTEIKVVNNTEFDKMYIAEDDFRKQIFAYIDNQVIHVTYYGKVKLEDILPLVEEKIIMVSAPPKSHLL